MWDMVHFSEQRITVINIHQILNRKHFKIFSLNKHSGNRCNEIKDRAKLKCKIATRQKKNKRWISGGFKDSMEFDSKCFSFTCIIKHAIHIQVFCKM